MTAAHETARMLASLIGVDEDEATTKLARVIRVTAAEDKVGWAAEIEAMIARTVSTTREEMELVDLELVVGDVEAATQAPRLHADIGVDRLVVGSRRPAAPGGTPGALFAAGTAPIVAAMAIRAAIADERLPRTSDPLDLHIKEFGIPDLPQGETISLDGKVLVGAGAVAHGFLKALRHVPVTGTLDVVDPKDIGVGNLNRCLYLFPGDEGRGKAEVLVERAAADFPSLTLRAVKSEFSAYAGVEPVAGMIVTVDSRVARRKLQKFVPGSVLDASTTDVRFVVVHSNRQPGDGFCMACLYRHTPDEQARETSIAEGLGLDIDTVRTGFVTPEVAGRIVERYPQLDPGSLVNKAFDTLFRDLCSQQALSTSEGRQVFTPFAFVSAMAGALLAIELVRQHLGYPDTSYWQVDPWRGPFGRTRSAASKRPDCEFCADPGFKAAIDHYWRK